jgi:hypothetical protein
MSFLFSYRIKFILLCCAALFLLGNAKALAGGKEEALAKSKDAALIQSGLQIYIDNVKNFFDEESEKRLKQLGINREAAAVGFIAKALYDKKLVLKYRKAEASMSRQEYKLVFTWRF